MIRISERVVVVASALLPSRVRSRYREQWLGELRDAPSVGMRPSEIAMGSLAFAATFERSVPVGARPGPEVIARRGRLAMTLSISAAVLAFSQTLSAATNAQIGSDAMASAAGAGWALLTLYAMIAPIAAVVVVLATRGVSWAVRGIVLLLAALCAVPLAQPTMSSWISTSSLDRVHPVLLIMGAGVGVFLVALVATSRQARGRSNSGTGDRAAVRLRRGVVAGFAVTTAVCAGFLSASLLWASRTHLYFPGPITDINRGEYEQWQELKASGEQLVAATLGAWLALGLVVACAVALSSASRRSTLRRTVMLGVGAMAVVVVSFGLLLSFLQLMLPSIAPSFPVVVATEAIQIGLILVVLIVTRKPRTVPDLSLRER